MWRCGNSKRALKYLSDRVSTGGGCEAAVTASRCWRV